MFALLPVQGQVAMQTGKPRRYQDVRMLRSFMMFCNGSCTNPNSNACALVHWESFSVCPEN